MPPRVTHNQETFSVGRVQVLAVVVSPRPRTGALHHPTPPSRTGKTPFTSNAASSFSPRDAVLRRCLRLDIKSQVPDVARVARGPVAWDQEPPARLCAWQKPARMCPPAGTSTTQQQQQQHRHRRVAFPPHLGSSFVLIPYIPLGSARSPHILSPPPPPPPIFPRRAAVHCPICLSRAAPCYPALPASPKTHRPSGCPYYKADREPHLLLKPAESPENVFLCAPGPCMGAPGPRTVCNLYTWEGHGAGSGRPGKLIILPSRAWGRGCKNCPLGYK